MPTTDIIGYLWLKRQDLELDGLPDVLNLIADFQELGLECIRVNGYSIFGVPTGAVVQLIQREHEEWDELIHNALLSAAVGNTIAMLHEDGDDK